MDAAPTPGKPGDGVPLSSGGKGGAPPAQAVPPPRMFLSKVTWPHIERELSRRLQPGERAVILIDGYDRIGDWSSDARIARLIDVRVEPRAALDSLEDHEVVIYACAQDDLGLPFIARLHELGRRYYPIWSADPGGYAFSNTVARDVLHAERTHQIERGFGKWDFGYRDFENLIQAVEVTRHLAGCYLEVGCYRGSSAGVVLRYLAAKKRSIRTYFLDVFEGFNYSESQRSADAVWHGTHATEGFDHVQARLLEYAAESPGLGITVEKCNIITDPLPAAVVQEGIAVANLDVDLHEAVYSGLHKIAPHVVPGGILVVEDPGHTPLLIGARLALERFLAEDAGKLFLPLAMQSGQTFLVRR